MIVLQPATAFHAPALAELHAAAFPPGERWGADAIGLQLGLPGVFGAIADEGGFILARIVADEAEILTLAVDPATQRRGFGRRLVDHALREAGARAAQTMFLEVSALNRPAQGLYTACGFVEIGRRSRYYPHGVDALVLRAPTSCGSKAG